MPYRLKSAAGPWTAGQVVDDEEFNAHPFSKKFLDRGTAEQVADEEAAPRTPQNQEKINDLDSRISALQAERAALVAEDAGEPAPQVTEFVLPKADEPANSTRKQQELHAEGREVVQPGAGLPVMGEVVSSDAQAAASGEAPQGSPEPEAGERRARRSNP